MTEEHDPERERHEGDSQFLRSAAESVLGRFRPRAGGEEPAGDAAEDARTWRRRARATYRRRVRLSLSEIYLQLGAALAREQRFNEATDAFQRALQEGGNVGEEDVLEDLIYAAESVRATDLAFRARLELAMASPARASEMLSRASKLLDDDVAASQARWVLDQWRPRFQSQANDASSSYEACLLLGRVSLFIGDVDGAVAQFGEAAEASATKARFAAIAMLRPEALPSAIRANEASLHWVKARAYEALGLTARAIDEIDAALEEDNAYEAEAAMLELKARVLEAEGRRADAAKTLFELGRQHDIETQHAAATEAYRRATELDSEDASFWWYLADSRRLAAAGAASGTIDPKALGRARDDLKIGLTKRAPSDSDAWVYWAAALIAEGLANHERRPTALLVEAALDAEQAVALERRHPGPLLLLKSYYETLMAPAAAMCALAEAAERDGSSLEVRTSQLSTLTELGLAGALEVIDDFEPQDLANDWVMGARGFVLLHQHRYEEALVEFDAAVRLMPDNAWVLGHRALARGLTGDLRGGRDDALAVLELDAKPGYEPGKFNARAVSALLLDDPAQARELFEPNLDGTWLDPVEARVGLACAEQLAGNSERAAEVWADAANRVSFPRHVATARLGVDLLTRRGAAIERNAWLEPFRQAGDRVEARGFGPDEALDELAAIERSGRPGDAQWLMAVAARARVLAGQRRWVESAAAYEELIPYSSPSEPFAFTPARASMVTMLARESDDAVGTGDSERVLASYQRLIELGEASKQQLPIALAEAHRAAGRLDDALLALGELTSDVGDPDETVTIAWRLTGEIQLESGRLTEAQSALERALSLIPAGDVEDRAVVQSRLAAVSIADAAPNATLDHMRAAVAAMRPTKGRTRAAQTVVQTALEGLPDRELPLLPMTMRALIEDPEQRKGQRRRLTSARFESLRAGQDVIGGDIPLTLDADAALFPRGAESPGLTALIERPFRPCASGF